MLSIFITAGQTSYDSEFKTKIFERHPDWFLSTRMANRKARLLALEVGVPRHDLDASLVYALQRHTTAGKSNYDPDFDARIRERQPGWFIRIGDAIKAELLALEVGEPRPERDSRLGVALSRYVGKKNPSYDPDFEVQIQERQPGWFIRTADVKKAELLALPVGAPRPSSKVQLGQALGSYITRSSSCYDPEFTARIRERQPGWFKT